MWALLSAASAHLQLRLLSALGPLSTRAGSEWQMRIASDADCLSCQHVT